MSSDSSEDRAVRAVQAARGGSETARTELYELCRADLTAFLKREVGARLARAVSIHDLEQDAFLSAFEALPRVEGVATLDGFRGMLFRHARWRIFKEIRRHRRFEGESALSAPIGERGPGGDRTGKTGEVTRVDRSEWLAENVDRLSGASAEVVRMRLMGTDFAEIARELDLTEDAARKRYLRGLNELRGLLREPGT